MAIIQNGILGGFAGTVGTVVGGRWRGIDYMRGRSTSRKSSNSSLQTDQRLKFAVASRFLQNMKDLLTIGFRGQGIRMTEVNSALGYTLKNAITGTYPDFKIAYPQVLVTRGNLPNAAAPAAVAEATGIIRFNWTDNSGTGKARASDKALLVAYCEALKQAVFIIEPLRNASTGVLNIPAFSGQIVQTWISFRTDNGKDIASSLFTGEITVA